MTKNDENTTDELEDKDFFDDANDEDVNDIDVPDELSEEVSTAPAPKAKGGKKPAAKVKRGKVGRPKGKKNASTIQREEKELSRKRKQNFFCVIWDQLTFGGTVQQYKLFRFTEEKEMRQFVDAAVIPNATRYLILDGVPVESKV